MGPVEVVEVLPFLQFAVEDFSIVDDDSVEHPVELFCVDPVRSFDFPVQSRCPGFDVCVVDSSVKEMPVKAALEL